MLEYFGGATEVLVPDQLRSAISVPSRYEPTVQRTYAEFGRHYGIAIVPARPRKPRGRVGRWRGGFRLPVASARSFARAPQSGLPWLRFQRPLVEPDVRITRIRLSS